VTRAMNADDEIYLVRGEEIHALRSRSMKSGQSGQGLEEALQTLFQKHPNIIPGKQIEPGSDDPPRFVLLRRQMPVKGNSVGNLYVDQHGMLTVVETRLLENPESRREVVGQIIEHAANAAEAWGNGQARRMATEAWKREGKVLDNVLNEEFGDPHASESIWQRVEANLSQGRLRLIIATDELRPEVRRMIEYLNKQMRDTQVLGLELRCYGSDTDALVCVPRLVGQTRGAVDRRESSQVSWTVDSLRKAYGELTDPGLAQKLGIALDWAVENDFFIESRAESPSFGFKGAVRKRLGSFHIDGKIYLYLKEEFYPDGANSRDELLSHLIELGMLPVGFDVNQVEYGRNLIRSLADMSDSEFHDLLDVLTRHIKSAVPLAGVTT
jgi:hypothetical protein